MTQRKTPQMRHAEQNSVKLTDEDRAIIIHLTSLGFQYKRIAALFDTNSGRIADAVTQSGLKFGHQNNKDEN